MLLRASRPGEATRVESKSPPPLHHRPQGCSTGKAPSAMGLQLSITNHNPASPHPPHRHSARGKGQTLPVGWDRSSVTQACTHRLRHCTLQGRHTRSLAYQEVSLACERSRAAFGSFMQSCNPGCFLICILVVSHSHTHTGKPKGVALLV